jgi:hypothetical protein
MVLSGDHSAVCAEKYPYPSRVLKSPTDYDGEIARQKERIERSPELMNRLATDLYPDEKDDPKGIVFKYRGASVNEDSTEIIISYMGSIREPHLNAGYRAQWILDVEREYLTGVYLSVVPLE